jgi:hypothetical protein
MNLQAHLDETPAPEHVVWLRCGVQKPTTRDDGSVSYPVDRVTIEGIGEPRVLYDNRADPPSEVMANVFVTHFAGGTDQLLVVWRFYGTGNIHNWDVIDVRGQQLRRWKKPDLSASWAPLLHKGETVGKELGDGPLASGADIVVTQLVYEPGEPNCCPSGGSVVAHITGRDGVLNVSGVSRDPDSSER